MRSSSRFHRLTRRNSAGLVVGFLALAAYGSACSSSSETPGGSAAAPTEAAAESIASRIAVVAPSKRTYENFLVTDFDESSIIVDNKYYPLIPGTRYEYDGSTIEEGKTVAHRITFTVTNLTKKINGVNTVVVWESDFTEGDLEEDELTFFAQDKSGNVWHLGEYSELWDSGEYTAGRTWYVGHPVGAKAGIMMKADPKPNAPDWSEGYAPPPYFWTDRTHVREANQKTTVPTGTYEGVLVTEEYNEEEPNAIQLKYYAPGVGVVRVGWAGPDDSKESLVMVRNEKLTPEKLGGLSKRALELETRALVYGTADPSVQRK